MRRRLEGLLHPLRQRRALRLIRRHGLPSQVLFICHGNICRSPYAEAAFRKLAVERGVPVPQIRSAGFIGPGRAAPSAAVAVAAQRGVDLTAHVSQLISAAGRDCPGLVIVMEPRQRRAVRRLLGANCDALVLGDLHQPAGEPRRIPDPVNQPAAVFERVYDRIDGCLEQLVVALAG